MRCWQWTRRLGFVNSVFVNQTIIFQPISITSNGCLLRWDVERQTIKTNTNFSKDRINYAFAASNGFYCVSIKDDKTFVRKLVLTPEGNVESYSKIGLINQAIFNPKHITITVSLTYNFQKLQ